MRERPNRAPDLHGAFDYDVIADVVEWDAPDYEHVRISARHILEDLLNTAIREHREGSSDDH